MKDHHQKKAAATSRGLLHGLRRLATARFQIAVGGAQVLPVDVWTQLFAADGATCGSLDGRAALGRHPLFPCFPLTDHDLRYTDIASQLLAAAALSKKGFQVHEQQFSIRQNARQ